MADKLDSRLRGNERSGLRERRGLDGAGAGRALRILLRSFPRTPGPGMADKLDSRLRGNERSGSGGTREMADKLDSRLRGNERSGLRERRGLDGAGAGRALRILLRSFPRKRGPSGTW